MSTKSDAEQHSDDGVEYAVDGTEHSRDGYGNLRTLEEQREMLEEEEMLSQAARAPIEARKAMLRATNPVAFSIPEEVYKAAAEDPGSLSAEDRALILSRGDLAGRALVDPQSLTRAERYEILGWPAPEVIEPRLRAASRRSGFVVSTPAELYAKAEANGTATLMPEELQLAAWRFHDHDPGLPPFTSEVPGNGEAYNAVFKAEGLNLEVSLKNRLAKGLRQQALGYLVCRVHLLDNYRYSRNSKLEARKELDLVLDLARPPLQAPRRVPQQVQTQPRGQRKQELSSTILLMR
ncbi:hypothetical protein SBRCBS47491_004481 [Sporothrix bragantina]|uniref:Uncharacterized protein n=1 Tax=Sporothrix bragantina TaxID=671064 RepID=A0ABP0BQA9_9PEZI